MPYQDLYRVYTWGMMDVHHAIFLELAADGSGELYHAKGSVATGFVYEVKKIPKPELLEHYSDHKFLGQIKTTNKQKFVDICEQTPPPGAMQVSSRIRSSAGSIIQYRNCVTWVEEVLAALKNERILS